MYPIEENTTNGGLGADKSAKSYLNFCSRTKEKLARGMLLMRFVFPASLLEGGFPLIASNKRGLIMRIDKLLVEGWCLWGLSSWATSRGRFGNWVMGEWIFSGRFPLSCNVGILIKSIWVSVDLVVTLLFIRWITFIGHFGKGRGNGIQLIFLLL